MIIVHRTKRKQADVRRRTDRSGMDSGVERSGVEWCGVVRSGVLWSGVVRCGVVWLGVWCRVRWTTQRAWNPTWHTIADAQTITTTVQPNDASGRSRVCQAHNGESEGNGTNRKNSHTRGMAHSIHCATYTRRRAHQVHQRKAQSDWGKDTMTRGEYFRSRLQQEVV